MVDKFEVGKEYYKTGGSLPVSSLPVKCIYIEGDTAVLMSKYAWIIETYISKNPRLYDEYKRPLKGSFWVCTYKRADGSIGLFTFDNEAKANSWIKKKTSSHTPLSLQEVEWTEGLGL